MPPKVTAPHVSPRAAATNPCPASLSGRILLADDGPENQRILAYLLRRAGATVEVAEDGVKALEAIDAAQAANIPFDLLVTDRQMPHMDGPSLAAAVRARGISMPIIALTAHASPDTSRQMFASGCDDYAPKPIEERTLVSMCAHWLARGSDQPRQAA